MKINNEGLDLIQSFEALKLESYICPAGVRTIGYGHTQGEFPDKITASQADIYLIDDLITAEKAVNTYVDFELNTNEFSALVSLVFNIGSGAFKRSTLLKRLNDGQIELAADQFLVWRKSGGEVLKGLERRRAKERKLFLCQSHTNQVKKAAEKL